MSIKDLFTPKHHENASTASAILADNLTQPVAIGILAAMGFGITAIKQIIRNHYKCHLSWKDSVLDLVPTEMNPPQSKLS